jgi:hypothetical protein
MTKQAHTFAIDRSYVKSEDSKEFKSENKYRQERNRRDNKELKELQELEANIESEGDPVNSKNTSNTEDSTDWKKRYSDLRSHTSKIENTYKEALQNLELKVRELESSNTVKVYPKTEEEIQEWAEKYPEVAKIIQTIAGKTSDEAVQKVQERLNELSRQELEAERRNGIRMLSELHPDFMELKDTDKFKEWLVEQPIEFQNAILRPKDFKEGSVKAAAKIITMFKVENGLSSTKKEKTHQDNRSVATKVLNNVNEDPSYNEKEPRYTESQIARMTDREFEQHQSKILEAQRKGPPYFIYDLSGAAR